MYIVATAASWHHRPFLYAKEGLIRSEEEIADILAQGYVEAYYDPDKSHLDEDHSHQASHDLLTERPSKKLPKPSHALADELERIDTTYNACIAQASQMFSDARSGKVDVSGSAALVGELISSINRNQDALTSLAKIRHHDEYTFAHSINVAIFSLAFGRILGFEGEELQRLGSAALFHDIGKMRIPTKILHATRELTPEEDAIMKMHVRYGYDLLRQNGRISQDILDGVLDHHEKYNGHGYPNRKKGSEISPFARIISVADVYDELSSNRIFRPAYSAHKTLAIMYGMREETWEPGLVERFTKMLGIYPVGSCVALTMGYKGIVAQSNMDAPLYPVTILCKDPKGRDIVPCQVVNLAEQHSLQIIKAISDKDLKCNLLDVLKKEE